MHFVAECVGAVCARLQCIGEARSVAAYDEAVTEMRQLDTWTQDDSVREYIENTWMTESKVSPVVLQLRACLMQSFLICYQL